MAQWCVLIGDFVFDDLRRSSDPIRTPNAPVAHHYSIFCTHWLRQIIELIVEWIDSNGRPFLKRALKRALGDALTASDPQALAARIQEVFEEMDADGGGTLDEVEVQVKGFVAYGRWSIWPLWHGLCPIAWSSVCSLQPLTPDLHLADAMAYDT